MSILADSQVNKLIFSKEITIDPYFKIFQGPNCYHCHLGSRFKRINSKYITYEAVDPLVDLPPDFYEEIIVSDFYDLKPKEFILAETFEYLGSSDTYVIRLLNSSSIARLGISQAALGMINAGCGMFSPIKVTLELINNSQVSIRLHPTVVETDRHIIWGTEILKVCIEKMDTKPSIPYDKWKFGVYSKDEKVAGSKMAGRFGDKKMFLPTNSYILKKK